MIKKIFSNLDTFKELEFNPGFNLVLAKKSPGATDRQTRNGAGKSSIIELIHFLFGGSVKKDSIFKNSNLINFTFGLEYTLFDENIRVERSGNKPSRIVADFPKNKRWSETLGYDLFNEHFISNEEYKNLLGNLIFSLPKVQNDEDLHKYIPRFRSLLSYFLRRENEGGFLDPQKHSRVQAVWDEQVNLSYLLGIDWSISQKWQMVREREKTLGELKKAVKEGALGDYIGSAADLRTQFALAQSHVERLKSNLNSFRVLPEYKEIENEASQLTREIGELYDKNTIDNQLLADLKNAIENEHVRDDSVDVLNLYSEAGVILPDLVKRRINEVVAFHSSIIQNRKEYLKSEIINAEQKVMQRTDTISQKEKRKSELLSILMSHGAIDQYVKLQSELSRLEAEKEFLRQKLLSAEHLEGEQAELDIERRQLLIRLQQDFREQSEKTSDAIIAFESISKSLYETAGNLKISETMNGPQFDIYIQGQKSTGINKMQIFCFDMMLMILCTENKIGPGFLVHDSHLFDGVDSRQIAKALQKGINLSREYGFQYIVTMNDDDLPREYLSDLNIDGFINPVELTDATENGGLFGFRFD